MGKRGPKKTPTAVLQLRGSWRAKIRDGEPVPDAFASPRPEWLRQAAKEMWDLLTTQLKNMNVIGAADTNALARYCEVWALWQECRAFIAENGTTQLDIKSGKTEACPQAILLLKFGERLSRLENQFGLTPSARAQLGSAEKKETPSGKGAYFA